MWTMVNDEGKCVCMDNYKWNSDKTACMPDDDSSDKCEGAWMMVNSMGDCVCMANYKWNDDRTGCILDDGSDDKCTIPLTVWFEGKCECMAQHKWNEDMTACVWSDDHCSGMWTMVNDEGNCVCMENY